MYVPRRLKGFVVRHPPRVHGGVLLVHSWFRSAIARRLLCLVCLLGLVVGCSSPGDDVTLHGDVRLNRALWQLTERMAELKSAG